MASKNDPILGLFYGWNLGEDGWNTGMDTNLTLLGMVAQISVKSQTTITPPVSPANGDVYYVPTGATGEWSGNTKKIAYLVEGVWQYATPNLGWEWSVEDESDRRYMFNGTDPVDAFTLSSVGGTYSLVGTKTGNDVGIKGLSSGSNITITDQGTYYEISSAAGTTFTGLSDTPANYTGSALLYPRVNAGATALEFYDLAGDIITNFIDLDDTPATFAGNNNYFLRVNNDGNGIAFVAAADVGMVSDFTDLGDTPNTLVGSGGYIVGVNATADAIEFTNTLSNMSFTSTAVNGVTLDDSGGGTLFLADDGLYKAGSGFDPAADQTVTGRYFFNTSTSNNFWIGDDDPSTGSPTYFFGFDYAGGDPYFYTSTSEAISGTSATSYTYSSDDGVNGQSGAVITAGSAVVAATQEATESVVNINGDRASVNCIMQHPNSEQIDTSIAYKFEEYQIETNTKRMIGRADFGGLPFSSDFIMYNGSETNVIRHNVGITTEPTGATPPTFRSIIQHDFDPTTNEAGCRMYLGNEEFVTASVDSSGNEIAKLTTGAGASYLEVGTTGLGVDTVEVFTDSFLINATTTLPSTNTTLQLGEVENGTSKIYTAYSTNIQATTHTVGLGIADEATYGIAAFHTLGFNPDETLDSASYVSGISEQQSVVGSPVFYSTWIHNHNASDSTSAISADILGVSDNFAFSARRSTTFESVYADTSQAAGTTTNGSFARMETITEDAGGSKVWWQVQNGAANTEYGRVVLDFDGENQSEYNVQANRLYFQVLGEDDNNEFQVDNGGGLLRWQEGHSTLGDYMVWSIGATAANRPRIQLSKDTSTFDTAFFGINDDGLNFYRGVNGFIASIRGLKTFADDAAAGVGGLVTDDIYKTATGELRIKL